jgi:energy-coupling factor transporter ATP-binding protein EcfA2
MIRQLDVKNFRAFQTFRVTFGRIAILVGPNNAGKSTIIAALRTGAAMLRHARRRSSSPAIDFADERLRPYPFDPGQFGLEEDNLRHEFEQAETRLVLDFGEERQLVAVWPKNELGGFFFLRRPGAVHAMPPGEVRSSFPLLGAIPILAPFDRNETLLNPNYVDQTSGTRLASRHFRNELLLLQRQASSTHADALEEFLDFCRPWLPEMAIYRPALRGSEIDVFYRDQWGGNAKEIVWAGDGVQIFLQLLLHIFRLRTADTIILDEPDIYLHADLQRRLLRLLESLSPQVILATHSPEILVEAPTEAVVWMDRTRRAAIRAPNAATVLSLALP